MTGASMERSAAAMLAALEVVVATTTMAVTGRVTTPAFEVAVEARTVGAGEAESHGIMIAQRRIHVEAAAEAALAVEGVVIGALENGGREVVGVEDAEDSVVATVVVEVDAAVVERK